MDIAFCPLLIKETSCPIFSFDDAQWDLHDEFQTATLKLRCETPCYGSVFRLVQLVVPADVMADATARILFIQHVTCRSGGSDTVVRRGSRCRV